MPPVGVGQGVVVVGRIREDKVEFRVGGVVLERQMVRAQPVRPRGFAEVEGGLLRGGTVDVDGLDVKLRRPLDCHQGYDAGTRAYVERPSVLRFQGHRRAEQDGVGADLERGFFVVQGEAPESKQRVHPSS